QPGRNSFDYPAEAASGINVGPGKITDLNGTGFMDGGDLPYPTDSGGWADGSDDGDNGYTDDLIGWDFGNGDNDPKSPNPHGTLVAGTIGATGNNGIGVVGVNWRVQIMPLKWSPDVPPSSPAMVVPSIYYAVNNGARVSNNSLGAYASQLPPSLIAAARNAIGYAASRDHLFVANAANDGMDNDVVSFLPASFDLDNIISTAATDRSDKLAMFSNYGATSVDL